MATPSSLPPPERKVPEANAGQDLTQGKFFSGPISNKASVATLTTAVATLLWTIIANAFWTTVTADDLAIYISTTTVILTAVFGFIVPESGAYAEHVKARVAAKQSKKASAQKEAKRHLKVAEAAFD